MERPIVYTVVGKIHKYSISSLNPYTTNVNASDEIAWFGEHVDWKFKLDDVSSPLSEIDLLQYSTKEPLEASDPEVCSLRHQFNCSNQGMKWYTNISKSLTIVLKVG